MAEFLDAQLDFIFFFYGLAFILLGAVCFAIARAGHPQSWVMLGLFGFIHGACEWLDLSALIVGDTPAFAAVRTAVMAVSFLFLMEFARQEGSRLGWRMPGQWVYFPLVALIATVGIIGGAAVANVSARYSLAFVGALGTSFFFSLSAKSLLGSDRMLAVCAAAGFGCYAIAAGAIVPSAPIWPADAFNQAWFFRSTGIPIQLIRGLLACWIAFSVWAIWGQQRRLELSSERYARFVRKQAVGTLAAMGTILVFGWLLTEYMGEAYKKDVELRSHGELDLLASRFDGETAITDGTVKLLAGSAFAQELFSGKAGQSEERMLDLAIEASGALRGFILDKSGSVVASAGGQAGDPTGAAPQANAPYFQESMNGQAGHYLAFDAASGERSYFASHPIRSAAGEVVGVAVLKKSLDRFGADLRQYDRAFFLVDKHGVVMLTNRPEMMLRTMWPLSSDVKKKAATQLGQPLNGIPILTQEVVDGTWARVDGMRDYLRRRQVNHGEWSLVLLKRSEEIYASRVVGIAITLLATILALVYLLARERQIFDHVQMDKRLELQEIASDLRYQASTDALTGLNNRARFNEVLSLEMSRSQRHGTPLSLVLYDIDHFKRINDTHGHLVGDKVLIALSRCVASHVRNEDVLARWGGEEFVLLLPETTAQMAGEVAEKLREAIREVVHDEVGIVTCSFGVTQLADEDSVKMLIARADEVLYLAKRNGRNRVELKLRPTILKPNVGSAA
jgi:diguanylate cyclase (GGDEF)-like protein